MKFPLAFLLALSISISTPTEGAETGETPPAGATVLFDGSDSSKWEAKGGKPVTWPVREGYLEVGQGDIQTKEKFGDFTLHVEFWVPNKPPSDKGQARGNSGVYLQNRYEIQVLDSYGLEPKKNDCGAIYEQKAPDKNACKPPEQWQTYDMTFRAARFDQGGNKTANARVTVLQNGEKIHDDVEITGPTGGGAKESPETGPIKLQAHGNPVRYRNIWIVPESVAASSPAEAAAAPQPAPIAEGPNEAGRNYQPGLSLYIYQLERDAQPDEAPIEGQTPNIAKHVTSATLQASDLVGIEGPFLAELKGEVLIDSQGDYTLRSKDTRSGKKLPDTGLRAWATVNGRTVLRPEWNESQSNAHKLEAGSLPFTATITGDTRAADKSAGIAFGFGKEEKKKSPVDMSEEKMRTVVPPVYVTSPGPKRVARMTMKRGPGGPGDGRPLAGVHPGFDLSQARPPGFEPRVSGLDFLPDGRLVVVSWEKHWSEKKAKDGPQLNGTVFILTGVDKGAPREIKVEKVEGGFEDPMGLKVVGSDIYVAEKFRLTRLSDKDGDGKFETRETAAEGWPGSDNFHEFSFGLEWKDGKFWIALSVALQQGGKTLVPQRVMGRGSLISIDPKTGKWEIVASGLRAPNGMGIGPDGDLFGGDNQGGWLPSSKINHYRPGVFFGHYNEPPSPFQDQPPAPPALWLPHGAIGRSPGGMTTFPQGTLFAGQLVLTDVAYGGLRRAFLEKVGGEWQGSVMRFTQGLEAGTNRIVWRDGAFYVGGIGAGDENNWGWKRTTFGLQKLTPNGGSTFEILRAGARPGGLLLRFTEPANPKQLADPASYRVKQWHYTPTQGYGGKNQAEEDLAVAKVTPGADGRSVLIDLPGMKAGKIVYVRLEKLLSADEEFPWSTDVWYTMNAIPDAAP